MYATAVCLSKGSPRAPRRLTEGFVTGRRVEFRTWLTFNLKTGRDLDPAKCHFTSWQPGTLTKVVSVGGLKDNRKNANSYHGRESQIHSVPHEYPRASITFTFKATSQVGGARDLIKITMMSYDR